MRRWLAAIFTAFALLTAGGAHAQTLTTATLDMTTGDLTLVFSGDVSTLVHSRISIRNGDTTTGGVTMDADQLGTSGSGSTVTYTLTAANLATVLAMADPKLHFALDALTVAGSPFPRVFDVRDAVYSKVEFNPRINPVGITFNSGTSAGTLMFLATGNTVQRFALSTAFDLSTATRSDKQIYNVRASDSGANSTPQDVAFNPGGTKMFVVNHDQVQVGEYTLTTGYDLTTASFVRNFEIGSHNENEPSGIAFSADGMRMFIIGRDGGAEGDVINEIPLSTPFDLSSTSVGDFIRSFNLGATFDLFGPIGITFNADGTRLYLTDQNDTVFQYDLLTAYTTVGANTVNEGTVRSQPQQGNLRDVVFNTNGDRMYTVGINPAAVHQFTLNSPRALTLSNLRPTISDNIAIGTPATRLTDTANSADGALTFTLNFNEAVTGFEASDISVTGGMLESLTPPPVETDTYTNTDIFTVVAKPDTANGGMLTITVRDAAATAVLGTDRFTIEVAVTQAYDTQAPPAPTFGDIATDEVINRSEQLTGVDLTGTVESGASVELCFNDGADNVAVCTDDGVTATATPAAGTTTWSHTLSSDNIGTISEGIKTLRAVATDAVGNPSAVASTTFTVDTVGPDAPTFDAGSTDAIINAAEALAGIDLTGGVEIDASVELCFNDGTGSVTSCPGGTTADTTTAAGTTTWSRTLTSANIGTISEGTKTLRAMATDSAGNPGAADAVASTTFTVDTIAPGFSSGTAGAVAINAAITVTAYDANATNNGGDSETADAGVTYTLGGINAGEFNIVAESGIVTYKTAQTAVTTAPHHRIVITATDTAGNPTTHDVTIEVLDVPEVIITNSVTSEYTNAAVTFTFSFSEAVTDFAATGDVAATGGMGGVISPEPNAAMTYTTTDIFTFIVTPDINTNDGILTVTVLADAVMRAGTTTRNLAVEVIQKYDTVSPIFANDASSDSVRYIFNDLPLVPFAYDADATDGGGTADDGITYSLSGDGAEDALFTIDPGTGIVSYITLPIATELTHNISVVATDKGGNPDTLPVTINVVSRATVVSVSATDGFYKVGDTLSISLTFSESVTVSGIPPGILQLALATNTNTGVTGVATYTAGSGTKALTFTYNVVAGDDTRNLAYTGTDALSLNNGTIQTRTNLDTNLTLPAVGSANSLSGTSAGISAIVLDTAAPVFPGAATTSTTPLVRTIAIGSTTATVVYDAAATDAGRAADTGISYTLDDTDAMTFAIDADTGVITPALTLASAATYTLTLTAMDEVDNVSEPFYLRVVVSDLPIVTLTRIGSGIVNSASGALTFELEFSEDVFGFERSDITVTGGSLGTITPTPNSATTYTSTDIFTILATPDAGMGMLTITVAADAATAVNGNNRNTVESTLTQAYDTLATAPIITTPVATDDIIDTTERAGTVPVAGTNEAGASVSLCINPTTVTDVTCAGGITYPTIVSLTAWRIELTTVQINAITPGIVTLTAIATDMAGNAAVSPLHRISLEAPVTAGNEQDITLPGGLPGSVTATAAGNLRVTEAPADTAASPSGIVFSLTVDIALTDNNGAALTTSTTVCLSTTGVPSGREAVLYHYVAPTPPGFPGLD